jgi:GTP 3',8-cyclase
MIAEIPGIDDIALSTNGLLLAEQVRGLVDAGLKRANISLDTLREDRFEAIARRPGLQRVLEGIDAAFAAGLGPLKLNCVVMRGQNDDEVQAFAEMTRDRAVAVRFIEVMPVHENVEGHKNQYISATEILDRIRANGDLHPIEGPKGNGPARYYAFDGAAGSVGVISPLSHDYCDTCNRVRLSADGRLKLCLFGDHFIDLRTPVRDRAGEEALIAILRGSMYVKPERHHLDVGQTASAMRALSEIGG